jgi:hypothetical protein
MKRLLCGSVVLAASLGLVSCNGDPTSDFRDGPTLIVADPSTMFVDQGDAEEVVVKVTNDAGDPLATEWEVTETGSGISVERNPDFLPTTVGAPLESEVQFIVTAGDAPTPSSFTISAGELSLEVPVNVLPTSVPSATFSNAAPAINELVTLTAEGYTFLPDAAVVIGGDSAAIIANDGNSITFVPVPGSSGPATLGNVAINFLPTTPLSVPTTAEIAVGTGPVAGSEDPATAPTLPTPALGEHTVFFDTPDFVTTIDHWYQLTVTEAGLYTITVDWDIGSDIDVIFCEGQPAPDFSNCPLASFVNHPEEIEAELVPGTYLILVEDFGVNAAGATVEITVQHDPIPADIVRKGATTTDVRKLQRSLKK